MTTWREGLAQHNNDYSFDPRAIVPVDMGNLTLSVAVLHYNTGAFFEKTAGHLKQAIDNAGVETEVIIVDDGSRVAPPSSEALNILSGVELVLAQHKENRGRTAGRNTGLRHASGEILLCMDSDTILDAWQLRSHLNLHARARQAGNNAIVGSLFEHGTHNRSIPATLSPDDVNVNDWRQDCIYRPSWIGCEADKAYVGRNFRLLEETRDLRDWHEVSRDGQYGPWVLPNMILGGLFSVVRQDLQRVGGFDERFNQYGFDETPGLTKLLVAEGHKAIPNPHGGAITLPNPGEESSRTEKDAAFRRMHELYFTSFLQESTSAGTV